MTKTNNIDNRAKALQDLILDLQRGASVDDVRARFHAIVMEAEPDDVDPIKQQLVQEGVPEEKAERWSEAHIDT